MKAEAFSSPIFVKRSTYIVQEIASLAEAIDLLDEWPPDRRDRAHETALRTCHDAYDGHKPVGAARNAALRLCKAGWHIRGCDLCDAVDCCLQSGHRKSLILFADATGARRE
ncbi:DUF982 domain-containing protein [Mesorhizobium sp. M0663]|uniref:DUF982 domain-containing protein n=1 Tax=Mesorhizobium sp. M0663 TaxID=2956981 RepID=UPI003337AA5A